MSHKMIRDYQAHCGLRNHLCQAFRLVSTGQIITSHRLRVRISSERGTSASWINTNSSKKVLCRQKQRVCLVSLKVPCLQLMPIILENQWKLRKWVYLRPTLHSQKPAQTSISQNAQKLMESMVSHLKSLVSSVKKTELQLYQEDVVPPTKDWKALYQWDHRFSLIFITTWKD